MKVGGDYFDLKEYKSGRLELMWCELGAFGTCKERKSASEKSLCG